MPTVDNLYALSELLKVPLDMLVCGSRRYDPFKDMPASAERLFLYYRLIRGCMAGLMQGEIKRMSMLNFLWKEKRYLIPLRHDIVMIVNEHSGDMSRTI